MSHLATFAHSPKKPKPSNPPQLSASVHTSPPSPSAQKNTMPPQRLSFMSNTISRTPVSRIAIGTYRMSIGSPENERAIFLALSRQQNPHLQINTVDTSTNYMGGGAEMLIGKVLTQPQRDTLSRKELHIASKFGYIQGPNMTLYQQGAFESVPESDLVKFTPDCYHCIHPEFMRDQLKRSLGRIQSEYLDTLFIHNPEYFLKHNIKSSNSDIKGFQSQMLERIGQTFEALEQEVAKGTIRSYGISSNSFSVPPEDPHFLPYHSLVDLARNASHKVRGDPGMHGFAAIQMPGNFLEQEGLKVTAKWAKKNGLKVFINRPLNAFNQDGAFRLASYAPPNPPYATVYNETLTQSPLSLSPNFLVQLIHELDSTLPALTSVFDYESVHHQVQRLLRARSAEMRPEWSEPLQRYLDVYEQEVRHRGSQSVQRFLQARGVELPPEVEKGSNGSSDSGEVGGRIERFALEFLAEDEQVDCVLLGMTRPQYVEVAREVLRSVADEEVVGELANEEKVV